jgi:hypothetical protein
MRDRMSASPGADLYLWLDIEHLNVRNSYGADVDRGMKIG